MYFKCYYVDYSIVYDLLGDYALFIQIYEVQQLLKKEKKMKIGVDIGGSHIGMGLIDDEKNIIERFERDFSEDEKTDVLPVIENFIIEKVKYIKNKYENIDGNIIESIGIAVPGTVKDGFIVKTVNLGVNNYDISNNLSKKINLPIFLRNDGKCACIAEYHNMIKNGEIQKDEIVLFMNIGTGIGGGVIYDGNLLKGNYFDGFEFGHMVIKDNGVPCKCGRRGCFEKYGSILEYKNRVKQRLGIPNNINGNMLREIMDSRKDEIEDLRKQYISDLCIGFANLINIFEPDTIVLGGGFTHFSYMFLDDIEYELVSSELLFNRRKNINIKIAELGNDAGIIGSTY